MAKCKYCGAEVAIGARCTYCGSKAESWYYSGEEKKQEPKKKKASHDRVRDLFNGKIYIVKKGDCLWNIAKNLYGSGAEYYRLVKLNNIQDPNHIEVGQSINRIRLEFKAAQVQKKISHIRVLIESDWNLKITITNTVIQIPIEY